MKISIIVANNLNNVIGDNGKIPWKSGEDLKHFKQLTEKHHVLMGRKTFESIGKPLPNRTNLLITKNSEFKREGTVTFNKIEDAINFAKTNNENELFVIGGEQIYRESLTSASTIYQTLVLTNETGDTYFPTIDQNEWKETSRDEHLDLNPPIIFRTLERK